MNSKKLIEAGFQEFIESFDCDLTIREMLISISRMVHGFVKEVIFLFVLQNRST